MPDTQPTYCNIPEVAGKEGRNLILAVYPVDSAEAIAVGGQQGMTVNKSADTTEVQIKGSTGWKSFMAGQKEWSIDIDGLYIPSDSGQKTVSKKFDKGEYVCLVVKDITKEDEPIDILGGLAIVTDDSKEAPSDDAVTYSNSFQGTGPLVDLMNDPGTDTGSDG